METGETTATKLERLLIEEISAVDDPANQIPGFMVAKAAGTVPVVPDPAPADAPQTIVEKIRGLLFPAGKDDIEMTSEELTTILDSRDDALVEKFAAVVKSAPSEEEVVPGEGTNEEQLGSLETPDPDAGPVAEGTPPAGENDVDVDVAVAVTAEDVDKAIQDALASTKYSEILEKTLDRMERIEISLGIAARKSLEGQEDGSGTPEDTPTPPTFSDAFKSLVKSPIGSAIGSVERKR